MSNDQTPTWVNPNFKTHVTPEYLCKLMPDQSIGEKRAIEHFYNKFKLKAEEAARRGESDYVLEITNTECGVSSDFEFDIVVNELANLFTKEKYIILKKELKEEEATLQVAWKAKPSLSKKTVQKEERQLASVPMQGGHQLNPAMLQHLAQNYQMFVAAHNPQFQHQQAQQQAIFYPPNNYASWAEWPPNSTYATIYPSDGDGGYSSPNPNVS